MAVRGPVQHAIYLPMVTHSPTKLGLAGGNVSDARMLGASWLYAWTPWPDYSRDVEGVPMIWGAFPSGQVPRIGGNSKWLLTFNEPDLPTQSDITPERGARLYREIEQAHSDKHLVSPVPFHIAWLNAWYSAYLNLYGEPPRVDAIAWHCYYGDAASCIAYGRQYVALAHLWQVKELWLTEFMFVPGKTPTAEQEATRFTAWLDAEPLVTRYSPFVSHCNAEEWWCAGTDAPGMNPSLLDDAGALTEIGTWYARPPVKYDADQR